MEEHAKKEVCKETYLECWFIKSVIKNILVCILLIPQMSNTAAISSSLSPSTSENSEAKSSSSISKLEILAAQASLPRVEPYLDSYYQALKRGQSASRALENINNKIPIGRMVQELIAQKLYKKYESDILKLIFNRPIYKIEQPKTTDFDYDGTGKYFSTISNNGNTVRIWNTQDFWKSGRYTRIYSKTFDKIIEQPLAFGPDGKAYTWTDNHLISIDTKTKAISTFGQLPDDILYDEVQFIFLNGIKLYAVKTYQDDMHHSVKIVNIETGETVKEIDYSGDLQPEIIWYSKDAHTIFIIQSNDSIKMINPKTLEEKLVPSFEEEIAVTRNSKSKLFIGDITGNIIIWDIVENKLIKQLDGEDSISHIAVPEKSNSKLALCVEGAHNNVILYDLVSGRDFILEGHQDTVNACEFTHDGNYLVSTSRDGTIRLWSTGQESLINVKPSDDGTLKIKPIATITGHSPEFGQLAFQPQHPLAGFHIFTCAGVVAEIPTIRIWFLPTPTTFSFDQIIYLLALAKLLDQDFLKTFRSKEEYNNYIAGLKDARLLETFSLPVRTNIFEFLKTQQTRKVTPAMTLRKEF